MSATIGVVLAQLGTPVRPTRAEVRRYLREFLSDPRVVDLPRWRWMPILHGFVLTTRPQRSLALYEEIWTDEGSPLLVFSRRQQGGIQERLGDRYRVELGLAYSSPSMADAVARLERDGIRRIVVLPLFPQYSTTTTASVYDAVTAAALGRGRGRRIPEKKFAPTLRFIHPFHDDPAYISVLAGHIRRQLEDGPAPDRVILSFHGLPRRFAEEGDPYVEQCATTTRLLVDELGWGPEDVEMAYQSRFGRTEWVRPYLQPRLGELHGEGLERVAVISPGFVTDCLETLHELAIDGRRLFAEGGGDPDEYRVLSCLNDDPAWLDYAAGLIRANAAGW